MRKQNERNGVRQERPSWLQTLRRVPGGLPLMAFFLVTLTGAGIYFIAAGVFCLRQGDPLFARGCLLFAFALIVVEALGLLSALLQERFPRLYRFMWVSGKKRRR